VAPAFDANFSGFIYSILAGKPRLELAFSFTVLEEVCFEALGKAWFLADRFLSVRQKVEKTNANPHNHNTQKPKDPLFGRTCSPNFPGSLCLAQEKLDSGCSALSQGTLQSSCDRSSNLERFGGEEEV
jgi:hypothetical protein